MQSACCLLSFLFTFSACATFCNTPKATTTATPIHAIKELQDQLTAALHVQHMQLSNPKRMPKSTQIDLKNNNENNIEIFKMLSLAPP